MTDDREIQYYRNMLYALIEDIEDVNILVKIIKFVEKIRKWEWK